jgi:release factor glutamine methyltransferase
MLFHQIKHFFINELSPLYSKNELQAMWNLCLMEVLYSNQIEFLKNPLTEIEVSKEIAFLNVLERLKQKEPIQYILENAWFCDSKYVVTPAVLIPRPETEELVYLINPSIENKKLSILDIGTGSGCIAISLKKYHPQTHVIGVDISEEALLVAQKNGNTIIGKDAIEFIRLDALNQNFAQNFNSKFDIIVSNPPYITIDESSSLESNVINFEPHLALFCDHDPLLFYRSIIQSAKQLLTKNGLLFFEIHENMAAAIYDLLLFEKFSSIEIYKDFQKKDRIIKARYNL